MADLDDEAYKVIGEAILDTIIEKIIKKNWVDAIIVNILIITMSNARNCITQNHLIVIGIALTLQKNEPRLLVKLNCHCR